MVFCIKLRHSQYPVNSLSGSFGIPAKPFCLRPIILPVGSKRFGGVLQSMLPSGVNFRKKEETIPQL
jgi:hypothetical protein